MPPKPRPAPDPWTPTELDDIVEQACRFIAECKKRRGRAYGIEVGEFLLLNLYHGVEAEVSSRARDKEVSLRSIEAATGVAWETLRAWVVGAIVRRILGRMGVDPALGVQELEALYVLREHLEAMAELARRADEQGMNLRQIEKAASNLRDFLDEGGTIEDWLAKRVPRRGPRKGKGKGGGKGRRGAIASQDLLRVPRLLGMLAVILEKERMAPAKRARLVERLRVLERMLVRFMEKTGRSRSRRRGGDR